MAHVLSYWQSKGVVQGPYFYDAGRRIVDPYRTAWRHQIPVDWDDEFPPVRMLLGAEQLTVKELTPADVAQIESAIRSRCQSADQAEALEGELYRAEAAFRSRNRALILAKKANSGYRCEACGLMFEDICGEIGQEFIVAHHKRPIASGPEKTTLNDIALLCANCHAMIHRHDPPLTVEGLRRVVRRHRKGGAT
ncbi:MAG TPA: HNH endonuclease [Anaerolineae bacterium]|nr:HNH endonuclease [Anaerolineae bacterium]HPL28894.1 HNH endonuclease [Anaerolineae bacterium]